MAIPAYVHPIRLMLACVGIDPQTPRPSSSVALQLISSGLELPPTRVIEFVSALQAHFAPFGDELTNNPEIFLRLEGRVENLTSKLQSSVDGLGLDASSNLWDNFSDWLATRCRVDPETFFQLLYFAFGRLQAALYRPGTRPPALDELDHFCDALITASPDAFRAAHAAIVAETSTPDTRATRQRKQASVRPFYHLTQSERHEASGERHSALLDRLQAWKNAAETTIYTVAKFVWTIRGYPDSLNEEVPGKRRPIKGDVFNLAAQWCDRNAVPFPFQRDLYKLRNSFAHEHITFSDSELEFSFNDDEGSPLATFGFDAIAEVIDHDILIASHFPNALTAAESRHHDRSGDFDEAWATAKSCIPDLDLTTVDIDAIWPTYPRLAKFQYQRVATFRPIPVRSGHLDSH